VLSPRVPDTVGGGGPIGRRRPRRAPYRPSTRISPTESVGQKCIDLMADPLRTGADSSEDEATTLRVSRNLGNVTAEDFRGECVCGETAGRCSSFQTTSDVIGNVHDHRHVQSLRREATHAPRFRRRASSLDPFREFATYVTHCR
jgi:hypothetical protein